LHQLGGDIALFLSYGSTLMISGEGMSLALPALTPFIRPRLL
jgi:hypothetical protein